MLRCGDHGCVNSRAAVMVLLAVARAIRVTRRISHVAGAACPYSRKTYCNWELPKDLGRPPLNLLKKSPKQVTCVLCFFKIHHAIPDACSSRHFIFAPCPRQLRSPAAPSFFSSLHLPSSVLPLSSSPNQHSLKTRHQLPMGYLVV